MAAGCAPNLTCVWINSLEQELCEDCLLLRLSQWFGSACGCSGRALTPRKRSWEQSVLYFGIYGVTPSWKASHVESHRAGGATPLPGGCDPPPGVERLPFDFTWRMRGTEHSWVLSRFGFPPPRGVLRSLQEELLLCPCPSITHSPCSPCPSCGVCEAP